MTDAEHAGREVIKSVEVTLTVEIQNDEWVPYAARVNGGPRFVDNTGIKAIRRALYHSDDYSIPAPDENLQKLLRKEAPRHDKLRHGSAVDIHRDKRGQR